jgi:hypothetical protein
MRSKGAWILMAALLILGLQACSETTDLTSAPASSAPLKSNAVSNAPTPSDSQ